MAIHPATKRLLVVLLAGIALLNGCVFWRAWWQVVAGYPDFSIFYTAGLILRRGEGSALYSSALQFKVQCEFASVALVRASPLPYNHPPFEAALFIPLTYLPFLASYAAWIALNLCLLVAIVFFLQSNRCLSNVPAWMCSLAALAFFPIAYALVQGQDSIVLLAIYCMAYASLRRGDDLGAGLWLGLGLFKFHLVLPFVFVLLLRRRLRAVAGFVISGGFDLLISWLLVGWKELLRYPSFAWKVNREPNIQIIAPQNMANLRGLLTGWNWPPGVVPWLEILLLIASFGLLLWAARQWEPSDTSDLNLWSNGFFIAMIATFLVGYHGYNQDMSILFLPVLVLSCHILETPPDGWHNVALKLGLGVMFFSPIYLVMTIHFEQQHLFALVLLGLLGVLAAWTSALKRGQRKLSTVT